VTRLADISGYRVELDELASVAHECHPLLCRRTGSCCAEYDIWVGEAEVERMAGLMPHAARYARHLRRKDGGAADVFRPLGPDAYAIEKGPQGLCALAYRGGRGEQLCSLHSAALEAGLEPQAVKPHCCFTWPLSIASSRPPVLSIQVDALNFPCNRPREPDGGLDAGIARIVEAAFGPQFLAAILKLL
jgi:hypothetical protein